ncbi:MAG: ABC-2 family transporter protein, partial [Candidatus Micrarchaeota archaeon]|nr:ABC-2 family transporter protein [Candidatus Micrarchaeota archaeon]
DFDTFLVKPVPNYIPFMSTFNGSATAISSVVSGLIIFAYAASQMSFSAVQFAEFALVFTLGSAIAVLFTLVFIMVSYKFFRSAGWVNWAFDIFQRVVRYPLNIYGVIGSLIFTFLIPLGFATYYPAELLNGMVGAWWIAGIVVFSLVLIYLLVRAFNSSFDSYSSAMG